MVLQEKTNLPIIGATEYIEVAGRKNIPAKIDTGADSSSIWASHIRITKDGVLHFRLFDEGSPFYDGKTIERKNFKVAVVRSSSGHEQVRYRTYLALKINHKKIRALFNLSDRSRNNYPVLIGRRTITGKFLVDVSENHTTVHPNNSKTKAIQHEFAQDPYRAHCKYVSNTKKEKEFKA